MLDIKNKAVLAYVIGVAIGDGNLSNPNGRAVRLRITCDKKYPQLIAKIIKNIQILAPFNKVSIIKRINDNAVDISCYSNDWESILGWLAIGGSKMKQKIKIPKWILRKKLYCKTCICGLIETDGSIYNDREYITVNFVTQIPSLVSAVKYMINALGYTASIQTLMLPNKNKKFTFRIHKNAKKFIEDVGILKK
ncbi:MAG: LAGLIDADG family homing endonuclease [Patescibacteria group bacterium]